MTSKRNSSGGTRTGKKKGATVQTFSKNAQSRLRSIFRKLNAEQYLSVGAKEKEGRGLFVTLTLPQDQPQPSQKQFHAIKERVRVLLFTRFSDNLEGVIWKAEQQPNTQTLHLHLVLFLRRPVNRLASLHLIKDDWCAITKKSTPHFRRFAVDVQTLYGTLRALCRYLQKSPVAEGEQWTWGKVYGVWGTLPTKEQTAVDVSGEANHIVLIAAIRSALPDNRKAQKLTENWKGFSLDNLSPQDIDAIMQEYDRNMETLNSY